MTPKPEDLDPYFESRQEILSVANKRFRRHGFKSVTMDDLARDLGMSKKTLYEIVGNKQALVDLVLDADMEADDAAIKTANQESSDAISEMLAIAKHFTAAMREVNPAGLYDLQKYYRKSWERLDKHHNEKMINHVGDNILRGQNEGLYRPEINRDLIAQLFVTASQSIINPEGKQLGKAEWHNILNEFMLYHLLGVCSPAGRELLTTYLERTPNA